jgi:hypothetical protein
VWEVKSHRNRATTGERDVKELAGDWVRPGIFVENTGEFVGSLFESHMTMAVSDMIDTISNLLFRCSHKRFTRPFSEVTKISQVRGTYVVCLDCGKQFPYDLQAMRVGRAFPAERNVLHPPVVAPKSRLRYAVWGSAIPAILFLCKAAFTKRRAVGSRGPESK